MYFIKLFHLYLLVIISSCYGDITRNKRKITAGESEVSISPEGLRRWCGGHGMNKCSETKLLIKKSHDTSIKCNEGLAPTCPFNMEEKKLARSFYCKEIFEINDQFLNDIQLRISYYAVLCKQQNLLTANPSPPHDEDTYSSLTTIIDGIKHWYHEFFQRHENSQHKCCSDPETMLNKTNTGIPEPTKTYTPNSDSACSTELDKAFAEYIQIREYLDKFLYRVGTRPRTACPRGCIGKETIECGKEILYPATVNTKIEYQIQ